MDVFIESAGSVSGLPGVRFTAGDFILLNPNFDVDLGAEFLAEILDCSN